MSKFLTPPVWYDSSGNLVEILTGSMYPEGTSLGKGSQSGNRAVAIGTNVGNVDGAIAIGYASYCNIEGGIVIGTNARLSYRDSGTDTSIVIGNAGEVIGHGNIAIGEKINLGSEYIDGTENIVIGSNSAVYGSGCIAIGGGIQLGRATLEGYVSDIIQIGSSNKTYSAQIGDGNGILKCRASEIAPVSYGINQYLNSTSSTISYPDNFILEQHGVYEFVFTVNGGLQTVPIVFSGTKTDTVKTYFNLSYGDTDSDDMIIYGSVMWGGNGIRLNLWPLATPSGDFIKIYLRHIVYLGSF